MIFLFGHSNHLPYVWFPSASSPVERHPSILWASGAWPSPALLDRLWHLDRTTLRAEFNPNPVCPWQMLSTTGTMNWNVFFTRTYFFSEPVNGEKLVGNHDRPSMRLSTIDISDGEPKELVAPSSGGRNRVLFFVLVSSRHLDDNSRRTRIFVVHFHGHRWPIPLISFLLGCKNPTFIDSSEHVAYLLLPTSLLKRRIIQIPHLVHFLSPRPSLLPSFLPDRS